ncbi:MAG: glycine-rich domain-containing protein, partial [Patescibacteria group bacterium]
MGCIGGTGYAGQIKLTYTIRVYDIVNFDSNATTETFTTASSGNWTVPAGVSSVKVEAWGGGGGGGSRYPGYNSGGGGGGGGAYARTNSVTVVQGTTIAYVVGAAGSGNGGSTTFNSTGVVAAFGTGGSPAGYGIEGAGGAGGTVGASIGVDARNAGGSGYAGNGWWGGGGGGSGGSDSTGNSATDQPGAAAVTNGGAGGNGASAITPSSGQSGYSPGGGGGGGQSNYDPGAGAVGKLKLTYQPRTYISGVMDIGIPVPSWTNLSFVTTTQANTAVTLKARSANNSAMTGATDWASCTTITSTAALSIGGCVTNGHQYIQYQATLYTSDSSVTPSLNSVTIGYNQYNSSGSFISSVYNSSDSQNILSNLSWTGTTSSIAILKFQVATSSDGVTFGTFKGPDGLTSSFFTTSSAGTAATFQGQYFRYRATLTSVDGSAAPILNSVTATYVVNAAPTARVMSAAQNS